MFFPTPDTESENTTKTFNNHLQKRNSNKNIKHKRRKSHSTIKKVFNRKIHTNFASKMSNWAETFTMAATWQMKHQVAYWKAKAKSLEYENKVLHDIIRRKNMLMPRNHDIEDAEEEYVEEQNDTYQEGDDNVTFEVSDEYIQFLTENAKFKEEARLERERLRAEQDKVDLVDEKRKTHKIEPKVLQELYGKDWQKICALEVCIQANYIKAIDKNTPALWPNIPLNFTC